MPTRNINNSTAAWPPQNRGYNPRTTVQTGIHSWTWLVQLFNSLCPLTFPSIMKILFLACLSRSKPANLKVDCKNFHGCSVKLTPSDQQICGWLLCGLEKSCKTFHNHLVFSNKISLDDAIAWAFSISICHRISKGSTTLLHLWQKRYLQTLWKGCCSICGPTG
ncbi:hypothetical protein VP01_3490g1 [Puccinia sorghi]|uniref:Uncharacterized protein n=1 Tax=Puccinia sorghi TaxID=27349 RepID=A0A0L6UXQ7_9BASI|nr:hypothetical protein VP01_3490g1 [Puccinia sorghi]